MLPSSISQATGSCKARPILVPDDGAHKLSTSPGNASSNLIEVDAGLLFEFACLRIRHGLTTNLPVSLWELTMLATKKRVLLQILQRSTMAKMVGTNKAYSMARLGCHWPQPVPQAVLSSQCSAGHPFYEASREHLGSRKRGSTCSRTSATM